MHWGMMMTQRDAFDLEAAFDAARVAPPQMPDGLLARVAEDALAYQPQPPLWRRIFAAVGGAAGVGGLVTATAVGFWFGFTPPQTSVDPLVLIGAVELAAEDDMTDVLAFGWYSEEG